MDGERVAKIDFVNRRDLHDPDLMYGADVDKGAGGAADSPLRRETEKGTIRTAAFPAGDFQRHHVPRRVTESAMSPRNILTVLEGKARKDYETGDGSVKIT